MQSLKLTDTYQPLEMAEVEPQKPLTRTSRHFQLEPTASQVKFDWWFGVALPLVCVAADPFVFDSRLGAGGSRTLLGDFKVFAYVLSSACIVTMAAWLLWGHKLGELRPYIGGLFLAGSVISLVVGLILLPFSLVGMFVLMGFLGFTPLFSSFVYLRNGVRAIKGSKLDSDTWAVYRAVIIAALYSLIVPFVLNF